MKEAVIVGVNQDIDDVPRPAQRVSLPQGSKSDIINAQFCFLFFFAKDVCSFMHLDLIGPLLFLECSIIFFIFNLLILFSTTTFVFMIILIIIHSPSSVQKLFGAIELIGLPIHEAKSFSFGKCPSACWIEIILVPGGHYAFTIRSRQCTLQKAEVASKVSRI